MIESTNGWSEKNLQITSVPDDPLQLKVTLDMYNGSEYRTTVEYMESIEVIADDQTEFVRRKHEEKNIAKDKWLREQDATERGLDG